MKCKECGSVFSNDCKYCPECGAKVLESKKTIQLKCKACGGVLIPEGEEPVLRCPFCGSKELIQESDKVTIQRIKSRTKKEIEFERLKQEEKRHLHEVEKERAAVIEEQVNQYKKGKLVKITTLFFVICFITTITSFKSGRIFLGIISFVQTIFLAMSWLTGMKIIEEKVRNIHLLTAVIAFLLIVPFMTTTGRYSNNDSEYSQPISEIISNDDDKFVWPTSGINTVLPKPKSDKGGIIDSTDSFFLWVDDTSEQDYIDYVDACVENGFIIDAERTSTTYDAYNGDGYRLSTSYYKSSKSMHIDLDAPKITGTFQWPNSEIAKLIPQPKSTEGKIEWETEDGFLIYVGKTTLKDFNEYVDLCSEQGFNVDYRRGDKYYYADNKKKYHLSIKYEGNNTMFLRLDRPD